MMDGSVNLEQAQFNVMGNGAVVDVVDIQFNPASLQYTIQNTLSEPSREGVKRQYVKQSSGKLTMDLFYDTTHTGDDVRSKTEKVAKLMEPVADSGGGDAKKYPPVVQFEWGMYTFKGMVESYKETIDFFSNNGVPLRASINLTLSAQTDVFTEGHSSDPNAAGLTSTAFPPPVQMAPTSNNDNVTGLATRGGDPSATRALANANQLDSLRFTGGSPIAIPSSVNLQGPAAFATASASAGIGGGIGGGAGVGFGAGGGIGISGGAAAGFSAGGGISASAGAGFSASAGAGFGATAGVGLGAAGGYSAGGGVGLSGGASAGFSASASASFSAGTFLGTSANSAGVAATEGAFAGLRVSAAAGTPSLANLSVTRIRSQVSLAPPTTTFNASFGVGGKALQQGSAGLSVNVKGSISLADAVQFGD